MSFDGTKLDEVSKTYPGEIKKTASAKLYMGAPSYPVAVDGEIRDFRFFDNASTTLTQEAIECTLEQSKPTQ